MTSTKICTFTKTSNFCHDDSGTGLMYKSNGRYYVVGVVSTGDCRLDTIDLHTRVTRFLPWIAESIKGGKYCKNLAYQDGMPIRLSDIGRAEDSIENVKVKSWLNEERAILLAIYRQPGANTVEVVTKIRALFPQMEREAPPGVRFNVVNDRAEFIQSSINEVEFHLLLSVGLVVLVILAFLRNARSTLITALILPASVIGTFGAMYLLGFSLNYLSLMAIILAV